MHAPDAVDDRQSADQPPSATEPVAPPRRAEWRQRIIWRLAGATILLVTSVGLVTLVFSFLGRWFFLGELICNFRLQLIGALLLLTPFQAIWHQWRSLSATLLLIAVGGSVIWTTCVPDLSRGLVLFKGSNQRIMSFNVLGTNRRVDEVVATVRRRSPDVLVVIEYSGKWHQGLKVLHDEYPHRMLLPRWHGFGIALFSRHPIETSETVQLARDATDAPMVVATIAPPDSPPYRVIAVHLLAPMSPERMAIRNREIEEIERCVLRYQTSEMPTIVIGDFNCVPWSAHLQDMLRATKLRDSRRGFGYQGTWPSRYPIMRIPIDNCFVSRGIDVWDREVIKHACGSDHLPIVIDFDVTLGTTSEDIGTASEDVDFQTGDIDVIPEDIGIATDNIGTRTGDTDSPRD